jgi:hypothetical protein
VTAVVPDSLNAVRAIVIPEDSRDPIYEVFLSMSDGGLKALTGLVEGIPEEIPVYQRRDVVAFVNDDGDGPRNLRATRLLDRSLSPGRYVAGHLVLVGQRGDLGLASLPSGVTLDAITSLSREAK